MVIKSGRDENQYMSPRNRSHSAAQATAFNQKRREKMAKTPVPLPANQKLNLTNNSAAMTQMVQASNAPQNLSQLVDERVEKASKAATSVSRANSIFGKRRPKS